MDKSSSWLVRGVGNLARSAMRGKAGYGLGRLAPYTPAAAAYTYHDYEKYGKKDAKEDGFYFPILSPLKNALTGKEDPGTAALRVIYPVLGTFVGTRPVVHGINGIRAHARAYKMRDTLQRMHGVRRSTNGVKAGYQATSRTLPRMGRNLKKSMWALGGPVGLALASEGGRFAANMLGAGAFSSYTNPDVNDDEVRNEFRDFENTAINLRPAAIFAKENVIDPVFGGKDFSADNLKERGAHVAIAAADRVMEDYMQRNQQNAMQFAQRVVSRLTPEQQAQLLQQLQVNSNKANNVIQDAAQQQIDKRLTPAPSMAAPETTSN